MVDVRLLKVARQGNGLVATFCNELTGAESHVEAMQIIIEHGTLPMEEVYRDLRPHSSNDGVTDVQFMMGHGGAAPVGSRSLGNFDLHRIGDAVASRDVYSSIYEAYRLCSRM